MKIQLDADAVAVAETKRQQLKLKKRHRHWQKQPNKTTSLHIWLKSLPFTVCHFNYVQRGVYTML